MSPHEETGAARLKSFKVVNKKGRIVARFDGGVLHCRPPFHFEDVTVTFYNGPTVTPAAVWGGKPPPLPPPGSVTFGHKVSDDAGAS